MDVFEKVKDIIESEIGIEKKKILIKSNLRDDMHFNSLEFAQLANSIEEEFEISVPDDILDDIETVEDVVKLIEESI